MASCRVRVLLGLEQGQNLEYSCHSKNSDVCSITRWHLTTTGFGSIAVPDSRGQVPGSDKLAYMKSQRDSCERVRFCSI